MAKTTAPSASTTIAAPRWRDLTTLPRVTSARTGFSMAASGFRCCGSPAFGADGAACQKRWRKADTAATVGRPSSRPSRTGHRCRRTTRPNTTIAPACRSTGIIEGWQADAAAYRATALCESYVSYGEGERQLYDLFKPDNIRGNALVMFIHGGYWQALDRSHFSHMARGLNRLGLPVAVVGYDLCPQVELGHIVWELQQAAAALWRRFGLPVVATGHSAGGHLSACTCNRLEERRPRSARPARAGGLRHFRADPKPLTETSLNKALGLSMEAAESKARCSAGAGAVDDGCGRRSRRELRISQPRAAASSISGAWRA
ncbi:alpha/beta hydrolase [Bosea thiooxidans]